MSIKAEYLGMPLVIDDLDGENLAYFKHCAEHNFHLQQCTSCSLLRYPPATACPWCMGAEVEVGAGRGQGRGALLYRGASRHSAGLQGPHPLSRPPGRPRHAEGQADRARGAARSGQPRRRPMANLHRAKPSKRSASARACAWSLPMSRRVCRFRTGRSTKPRPSPQSPGAIRRSESAHFVACGIPRWADAHVDSIIFTLM